MSVTTNFLKMVLFSLFVGLSVYMSAMNQFLFQHSIITAILLNASFHCPFKCDYSFCFVHLRLLSSPCRSHAHNEKPMRVKINQ